jgi:hypothetical protein
MNLIAKAIETIINLKLEVKLGQLMRIFPQLKGMVENSLIKMREDQVADVCKVTTKVEDFDEVMPVVQVRVKKFEVKDVLLDSGFDVNIISESLRKKLGLKRPQSAPFVVRMAYQQKVQPISLIRNLKINLASCVYKILVIMLNMENGVEAYSMLLGRPWLKLVKAHHKWGDSTQLAITSRE